MNSVLTPTIRIGPGYVEEGRRQVRVVSEREKEEKRRKLSVFDLFVCDGGGRLTERGRDVHSEKWGQTLVLDLHYVLLRSKGVILAAEDESEVGKRRNGVALESAVITSVRGVRVMAERGSGERGGGGQSRRRKSQYFALLEK